MEAHDVADRTTLRARWRQHPDWPARWPARAFAEQLGRSPSWVRKWLARFRAAPEDDALLWGRSRARKHPPPPVPAVVVERILEIRDQPPERLQRTPGPRAILYSPHHRSPELAAAQLPCSTRTIWKILRAHDRLAPRRWRRPPPLRWSARPAAAAPSSTASCRWCGRASSKPSGGCSTGRWSPRPPKSSACSNPTRGSSSGAKPVRRWRAGARWSSTRSRAGS
jgi:hypothetical protein